VPKRFHIKLGAEWTSNVQSRWARQGRGNDLCSVPISTLGRQASEGKFRHLSYSRHPRL